MTPGVRPLNMVMGFLHCPHCASDEIVRGGLDIYNHSPARDQGTVIHVRNQELEIEPLDTDEYHQDEMTIEFSCRKCNTNSELLIARNVGGKTVFVWDLKDEL